jgi:hypothetical protein
MTLRVDCIKIVAGVALISATFVSHLDNNFVMFAAGPVAVPKYCWLAVTPRLVRVAIISSPITRPVVCAASGWH